MQHRQHQAASSLVRVSGLVVLATACMACAPRNEVGSPPKTAPSVDVAAAVIESPLPEPSAEALAATSSAAPIEYEKWWQGFGVPKCSYLAPKRGEGIPDFIGEDGGVDVIFHFHAGQMSEREMKESGVRGVFVSCGYGMGTGGYSAAFEDPNRFGWMMKRLMHTITASAKKEGRKSEDKIHLRHLALVSWSAGFAAVNRILAVPEWYEATDTVVLLDSLHAQYIDTFEAPNPHTPQQGVDKVDVRGLRRFGRFATDATLGKKTMVITHSAIVPPDYASTTEATAALLSEIGISPESPTPASDAKDAKGAKEPATKGETTTAVRLSSMAPLTSHLFARAAGPPPALTVRVEQGNLHVRGFRGIGPRDHFDHLHLIGEALRSWLVPRWYTPPGERP